MFMLVVLSKSKFFLVRLCVLRWNSLEPSIILLYEKLIELGFVYYNGEIQIVEPETEASEYHA